MNSSVSMPRDVAISYSKYLNQNLDETIDFMLNGQIRNSTDRKKLIPEIILNWGEHYNSWKKFTGVPRLFIKYENLKLDIESEINKIINFFHENYNLELSNKKIKIKNVIESTSIKKLQEKEGVIGFSENLENKGPNFFRKGKIDQWKNELNNKQNMLILNKFNIELKELNYL